MAQKKMKALLKAKREVGIWMDEVPVPVIGPDEVLIKVDRTGICGTDLHIYKWDGWAQRTIPVPMVVGHEFVGTIVETGSNVRNYQEGDLVSAEGHIIKSRCRNFLAGRWHLCKDVEGLGVNRTGAFAEYVAVPEMNVWKHDPKIDRDVAAIFDPFGNAVHTACQWNMLGEDVLITGAGPIGCMAAAVAKFAGARHVVVSDINPWRLNLARTLGATHTVNPKEQSLAEVQKSLGMKEGFDVGLEMSGNGAAFGDLLKNMVHGGKVSLLGIFPDKVAIDWDQVIFKMLTIKGIYGREMFETWYKMSLFVQGGLDISPVITHRLPADDFQKGFDAMLGGECGKVVLKW